MRYLSAHYIFPVSSPPIKNGILCVDNDGTIIDVIDNNGLIKEFEKLEFYNGILVPGFINAHCHLELSHLKGSFGQGEGLPVFITSVDRMRGIDDKTVIQSAKEADEEMRRNGIVAVGDISNRSITIGIKQKSRLRYHTFVEILGLKESDASSIWERFLQIEQQYHEAGLAASIVPHALYSISSSLFGLLQNYYKQKSTITSIHHQEDPDETSLYPEGKGELFDSLQKRGLISSNSCRTDIIDIMEKALKYAQQCLLIHNTHISEDDIKHRTTCLNHIFWVLCPKSNLYIQNQLPNITLFAKNNLSVCVGTDSLSSNTCLSILEELKTIHRYFPDISLQQLIQWATLNGALALQMDKELGSFEKGKKPSVNLISHIDFEQMQLTEDSTVTVL